MLSKIMESALWHQCACKVVLVSAEPIVRYYNLVKITLMSISNVRLEYKWQIYIQIYKYTSMCVA